jgi:hypothetical protein
LRWRTVEVPKENPEPLKLALGHMEAAIELLDSHPVPVGTIEYLDLAIHNLANAVDETGQTRLRQLARVSRYDLD